jgi:predicted glycosyltransferase involved in capsule biosynthesis
VFLWCFESPLSHTTLKSQYILFVDDVCYKNGDIFITNKDYHQLKTIQNVNLHMHQVGHLWKGCVSHGYKGI